MAETATRPGEGQAAGGAHPKEGETQEGDGETQISFISDTYGYPKQNTSDIGLSQSSWIFGVGFLPCRQCNTPSIIRSKSHFSAIYS